MGNGLQQIKIKTRVGKINYVNSLPFYHHLSKKNEPDIEFVEAVPARLNVAMQKDLIDIGPISSLEYLAHQDRYLLLPDFAVGARDFSGSVLLIAKEKIEGLQGARVALTPESLSSAALLKILLHFRYRLKNEFIPLAGPVEEALAENAAVLLIGDQALFYQPKEFVYKYDLSELWWNWTGRPFCFAVWAVRRAFVEKYPEEAASFVRRLRKNLMKNLADIEALIKESLGLTFMDARFPKIFGYLFNLSYSLDPTMREGLHHFFNLAEQLGLGPAQKELEMFKGRK